MLFALCMMCQEPISVLINIYAPECHEWLVFMTSLHMEYALCSAHVKHCVCHEPISVLINIFMFLGNCLLGTQLVLALTMRKLRHWPSITYMSPQSHCGDEDGRIGLSS